MRFVNLLGVFWALVFAFCLFACGDAGSSAGDGDTDCHSSSEDSRSSSSEKSSSSQEPSLPSIGVQNPGSGIGTCGPEKDVVEKDGSVKWKFTKSPEIEMMSLARAEFFWTFEGATPSTSYSTGSAGFIREVQRYALSGNHTASLVISTRDSTYNLTCSPVHVNGDPITGCKCTTEATSVDYTKGVPATWTVTGCTSAYMPLAFNWDGTDGSDTFTKVFGAPADSYAPVLKVDNKGNTVIDVTCPAVRVTDGPEYEIVATQDAGAIRLPAGSTMVTLRVDAPNSTVFCNVDRSDSPSGALNGSVNNVVIDGSDYISVSMPSGTLVNGATLEFDIDAPATCGVQ